MGEGARSLSDAYTDTAGHMVPEVPIWVESRTYETKLGKKNVSIKTTRTDTEWLKYALGELNRIAALPENWDSYGALSVKQPTLEHALKIYLTVVENRPQRQWPQISATVDGGIGFSWHHEQMGLEVEVTAPYQVHGYFYYDTANDEWSDNVGVELDILIHYLDKVYR